MDRNGMLRRLVSIGVLATLVACGGVEAALSNPAAVAGNEPVVLSDDHSDPEDYVWDSASVTSIGLNGDTITVDGSGVVVNGSTVTIGSAGTYSLSGSLTDGQIIVNTEDKALVQLILNGVQISSSTSAPLYIASAKETVIILADNSSNVVSDGTAYSFPSADADEPNAAIFSKGDLTIAGSGTLTVAGRYNDGIASKDGLVIAGGTITVTAVDDGIRGKDYLVVKGGTISVTAQGDGLKADNAEDAARGYISVESGTLHVTAGGDALQAETSVVITGGDFTLVSGGGSGTRLAETASAKGIKAVVSIQLDGGTFTIDAADDAINSDGSLVVNGGVFTIATGDDGMHANATLDINGGAINIIRSYEGIESAVITINAGNIRIVSSDDGLNVAGGNDSSGMMPGRGGAGMRRGQDMFAASGSYYLYINGGYTVIEADGDGVDVNGAIEMTGGTIIVNGPTANMNGALDYDGGFRISGGLLVAVGSAGMAQAPDESSTQNSMLINFSSALPAGTLIHLQSSDGQTAITFAPTKPYQSIALSSPELARGATYDVYYGGSSSGSIQDGLYQNGTYTPGTLYTSLTLSGVVTRLGGGRFR